MSKYEATKQKRKFSSFFKSLVIELDKDLYGPDNHLVEVRSFILCIKIDASLLIFLPIITKFNDYPFIISLHQYFLT